MSESRKNDKNLNEFPESSEEIMQETLKGIFEEVNAADEEEREGVDPEGEVDEEAIREVSEALREQTPDTSVDTVSGDDLDSGAAADEDKQAEEAASFEPVEEKPQLDGEDTELDLHVDDAEEAEFDLHADDAEDTELGLHADDAEDMEPQLDAGDAEDMEPVLDSEDGEEFEDEDFEEEEPLSEEEKALRRKKRKKALGIVFGSIFGVIAVAYLGLSIFFMSHFYFNTTINGVDFSAKSVENVESYMERQVQDYELDLNESDGGIEIIKGTDIDLKYEKGDELTKLMKKQNPFLWPKSLWEKPEITASVGVSFDEAKLNSVIDGLDCMVAENQVAPEMAKPEFDGNEFVVKPEVVGSTIETETFKAKAKEYIGGFRPTMDMTEEGCYVKPKYTSESQEVADACANMNKYMTASITYTFGSATEVVDKALISQWLTTDDNMAVTFNTDAVSEYIQTLASKYNTYKAQRTFTSGNGNSVSVEGGDYGWIIDKDAEYEALLASIQNGEVVTKEPAYSQTAASHDGADWGTTYVEVDLTNQYMWLFVNGSVVTSGPIVTGKPSAGDATPQGVYYIKYTQRNATLRGPKQPDGSYEWESPVSFWMPFNGGIGLHDAPWQAAFGGGRYLTHGSHGCVNLQYNVAQTTFNNVQSGTPVVCHY